MLHVQTINISLLLVLNKDSDNYQFDCISDVNKIKIHLNSLLWNSSLVVKIGWSTWTIRLSSVTITLMKIHLSLLLDRILRTAIMILLPPERLLPPFSFEHGGLSATANIHSTLFFSIYQPVKLPIHSDETSSLILFESSSLGKINCAKSHFTN